VSIATRSRAGLAVAAVGLGRLLLLRVVVGVAGLELAPEVAG
jgi:hypothetical protein